MMPSSDGVPVVTGGSLWELVLVADKERLRSGVLPGATTGGPAGLGTPGLWDVSLPTRQLAVDWGLWWQGTSLKLERC